MKNNKKKVQNESSMSLTEFKSWLNGLMEFQDDTWAPTPEQWRAIVDKIMKLKDSEPTKQQPVHSRQTTDNFINDNFINDNNSSSTQQRQKPAQPLMSRFGQPVDTGNDTPVVPPSAAPRVDMTKAVPFGVPLGSQSPAKTMDIDSSSGYKSALV